MDSRVMAERAAAAAGVVDVDCWEFERDTQVVVVLQICEGKPYFQTPIVSVYPTRLAWFACLERRIFAMLRLVPM
jgi:hypothetical protein